MPLSLFKASAPGFLAGMGVAVACAWLWRPAPLPSIYARLAPSVVSVELAGRQGSGFAVGVDEVLTAWHLVVGEEHCVVRGYGGEQWDGEVIGVDARVDLALIRVQGARLRPVALGGTSGAAVGEGVLAIGNPFGLGHSLTTGIIGGDRRRVDLDASAGGEVEYLQLSMPLNPGNSGGPIFSQRGGLIGALAGTHAEGQAIAFAVPVELLREALPALRRGDRVSRAFLGVRTGDVGGALVLTDAVPGGPASAAGARVGDRLLAVNGREVRGTDDLRRALDPLGAGDTVRLRLGRGEEVVELPVRLEDRAEEMVVAAGMILRPSPGTGGEVVAVRPGSRAERAGALPGDRVRAVRGLPVQAPADVQEALSGGLPARVEVLREQSAALLSFSE